MAEIKIASFSSSNGPHFPFHHVAILAWKQWPGGDTVPVLRMFVGNDVVEVWPAEPDHLDSLADQLKTIAEEIRKTRWRTR